VVQLSTQHNPFWPSLDLERKKFDQPHSVQRSTAVPQARRDDLQEKIDDWQREKDRWDPCKRGKLATHPHVPHPHHPSRTFPRLSKYRLFKRNHNEEQKGRVSWSVWITETVGGFDCQGVDGRIGQMWSTLILFCIYTRRKGVRDFAHGPFHYAAGSNCSSLFLFQSVLRIGPPQFLTRFI
jgi:hypothetical protein